MTLLGVVDHGEIAHAPQQPAGDAGRAAGALGDLVRAILGHGEAHDARAALHDEFELLDGVEVEADGDAETVAKRRREEARPRRRADEREFRKIDLDRARRRPLADHEIELKILHRGVEDLLDRRIEPVDLVDEQNVALLEIGEDRRKVARLRDDGAGGRAEADPHLARDDLGKRRLAEARRPDEQDVIERLAARPRAVDEHLEIGARLFLADEIGKALGPDRGFEPVVLAAFGRDQAGGWDHGDSIMGFQSTIRHPVRIASASDDNRGRSASSDFD